MNLILFSASDTGIYAPNFVWVLIGQLVGAVAVFVVGSLLIYKITNKLAPRMNKAIKFMLTVIIAIALVSLAGLITEHLDG